MKKIDSYLIMMIGCFTCVGIIYLNTCNEVHIKPMLKVELKKTVTIAHGIQQHQIEHVDELHLKVLSDSIFKLKQKVSQLLHLRNLKNSHYQDQT